MPLSHLLRYGCYIHDDLSIKANHLFTILNIYPITITSHGTPTLKQPLSSALNQPFTRPTIPRHGSPVPTCSHLLRSTRLPRRNLEAHHDGLQEVWILPSNFWMSDGYMGKSAWYLLTLFTGICWYLLVHG